MEHQKENYRQFSKSLLIYMASEAPQMEYQTKLEPLGIEGLKGKLETKDKPLTLEKFEGSKKAAERMINKISLDANPDVQTQPEKELTKKLLKHNEEQFRLLEHNYYVADDKLGRGGEEIKKAHEILGNAAHEFLKKLQVHIFKECAEKSTTEGRGEMIDVFLRSKGVALKGLGRYLVKGNWDVFGRGGTFESKIQNLKTSEEIDKKLEEILGDEKVLESAIWSMKKDLPDFEASADEMAYFQKRFDDTRKDGNERLTVNFGTGKNLEAAKQTLATRFHIEFKKGTKDPEYIVDLAKNKVYQPDSSEWQDKLKRVCHAELKNADQIKEHENGVANIKKERDAQFNELLYGKGWHRPDWEVHKFGRLKDNPLLTEVFNMSKGHIEQVNKGVNASLNEISRLSGSTDDKQTGWALDHLSQTLTPEKVRAGGLIGDLVELLKMIQEAVIGKDHETLKKMAKSVEDGKNPVEFKKEIEKGKLAARKNYGDLLEFKKPKLDQMLTLYQNPGEPADQFFQTAAGEMVLKTTPDKNQQGRTILQEHANAIKYRDERLPAIKNYMESQLKVSDFSVRKGNEGILVLEFKAGDTPKTFYLKKVQDKFEVTSFDEPDKKMPVENDLSALGKVLAVKEAPAKPAETAAETPEDKKALYEKALKSLPSPLYVKGTSVLGKLLKLVGGDKELPAWKDINGNRNKKQFELDKARAELIASKLTPDLMKKLENNPDFKAKLDYLTKQAKKSETDETQPSDKETPTGAKKVPGLDIKVAGREANVFFNRERKTMMIEHPLLHILFNEKGERIGYVGSKDDKDVFVFGEPPNSWQPDQPDNLNLDAATKKKLASKKRELMKG